MIDDQTMSAEDKAKEIMGPIIDLVSRKQEGFIKRDQLEADMRALTTATEAIATALREHASAAVQAEREACAEIAKAKMTEVNKGAFRDPETVRRDKLEQGQVACEIEFAIRQRTEGGDND